MKENLSKVLAVMITMVLLGLYANLASADDVSGMSKEDLKSMMGDPKVVIIDVRTGRDWSESKLKIKGAVREEPRNATSWADKYDKHHTYVLYCS
ncbi:MAG: hypothetical protein AMK69_14780 [Nitrospira bacterium SG8_3]|nr:MAG: hypothetical protein AMK69_14780 [Nitrospira bacterium SG8_3]